MTDNEQQLLEIKARLPILQVAQALGLNVNRQGLTNCFRPYNHKNGDKHPSLSFDIKTNRFKCFAGTCGISGDIFDLWQAFNGADFKEALSALSVLAGVKTGCLKAPDRAVAAFQKPKANSLKEPSKPLKTGLYAVLMAFCDGLDQDDAEYLISRGLTRETLKKFGVFSIKNFYKTKEFLLSQASLEDLQGVGLFNLKGKFVFDTFGWQGFYHRIVFPFFSAGKVVYLQGRLPGTGDPRFMNLKLVPTRIYNEDAIAESIAAAKPVYICEGVIDALTLIQRGYYAVGIIGTGGFKPEYIPLFKGADVVLMFDGDKAGIEGSEKAKQMFFEHGQGVRIKRLPAGEDVNSYFTKGAQNG